MIEHISATIESSSSNVGSTLPQFVAMEYYALILNRTYNVFIAKAMLCGANVRGIVANPPFPSEKMSDPRYWVDPRRLTLYENTDVTSPEFLRINSVNFQIPWSEVARIEFDPAKKWGMGNVVHSGRIFVHLKSGKFREFILLGEQDGVVLKNRLYEAISRVVD